MAERIGFKKGRNRGEWWSLDLGNGRKGATIMCPDCDHMRIINSHTIEANGEVNPSVVCSCGCDCQFHEFIILEGWVP